MTRPDVLASLTGSDSSAQGRATRRAKPEGRSRERRPGYRRRLSQSPVGAQYVSSEIVAPLQGLSVRRIQDPGRRFALPGAFECQPFGLSRALLTAAVAVVLILSTGVRAFDGHVATEGPLTVSIGPVGPVTAFGVPQKVAVTLTNSAKAPLAVTVRMMGLIDAWRPGGPTETKTTVPAGGKAGGTFWIVAGKGTHSALYPVHVAADFTHGGRRATARAVRIFEARLPAPRPKPLTWSVNVVAADSELPLASLRTYRLAWRRFDEKTFRHTPVGYGGTVAGGGPYFAVSRIKRGTTKRAICMHPPWRSGAGTVFAEYRLKLPDTKPIVLTFANAVRDHSPPEPPSDGVTFRVWAGPAGSEKVVFERHAADKKWLPGKADLSAFASKEIVLKLESHPGPKRNTTCDSSYWAEPVITAGKVALVTQPDAKNVFYRIRYAHARQALTGKAGKQNTAWLFLLADGNLAAIGAAGSGLANAAIAFGRADKCVVLRGIRVDVLGEALGHRPSRIRICDVKTDGGFGYVPEKRKIDIKSCCTDLRIVHTCELDGDKFDVTATIRPKGRGLQVSVSCPKRITDISPGPFDRKAERVYYGHGYCIVEPGAFTAGAGGHNMSTSHVGFDFAGGVSLLTACDTPPTKLEVDPATRTYALHTDNFATFTFVPGVSGAMECATAYRTLYDKKAAPGVKHKAGRFVFDIWGGRYAEATAAMQRAIAYGLTDAMLTMHVWQRWGYDYRLPEIYPPNPRFGTVDDLRKLGAVCAEAGIPWGLHDNYIDHYPDADSYSYETICFTPAGRPIKAWLNKGRNARSYRWRPDKIRPLVRRNLDIIKKELAPTHYFVDVFTSIPCIDFYDRAGKYHTRLETRTCWGRAFSDIRARLGAPAVTTSEAGHDHLVGYLDGADCQHLRITPDRKRFCLNVPCKDWQRVPWFDAVLHDTFILHGVGYSSRYQGGRTRIEAGIESDDYISAEVLTGHALMIDRPAGVGGAVRKYWLAQEFIRSIAMDTIRDVTFAGGDIHRQIVRWNSGATVHVNRGTTDWNVAGRVLPPYGYLAVNGPTTSAIERIRGVIVERSAGPGGRYVNARGLAHAGGLPIAPSAERVEYLGARRFRLVLGWQAEAPAPKDLGIFVHFTHDRSKRSDKIAFQGDYRPETATSTWRGKVTTGAGRAATIPPPWGPGTYEILIGLWDAAAGGQRYTLRGDNDGTARYLVGRLAVEGTDGKVTAVRLLPQKSAPRPASRWNLHGRPVDFGHAVTTGAFRCRRDGRTITVTPLPDLPAFAVTLRPDRLGAQGAVTALCAVASDGRKVRNVPVTAKGGTVSFRTRKGEFAYRFVVGGGRR